MKKKMVEGKTEGFKKQAVVESGSCGNPAFGVTTMTHDNVNMMEMKGFHTIDMQNEKLYDGMDRGF